MIVNHGGYYVHEHELAASLGHTLLPISADIFTSSCWPKKSRHWKPLFKRHWGCSEVVFPSIQELYFSMRKTKMGYPAGIIICFGHLQSGTSGLVGTWYDGWATGYVCSTWSYTWLLYQQISGSATAESLLNVATEVAPFGQLPWCRCWT